MKKTYLLFLFLILHSSVVFGQSFNTQTLYLKFDTLNVVEKSTDWSTIYPNEPYCRGFDYNYYPVNNGSHIRFWCWDKSTVQIISISEINNYPVKTLTELQIYFSSITNNQRIDYLVGVKNYYLVEYLPNNQVAIIPVKLDVNMDYDE